MDAQAKTSFEERVAEFGAARPRSRELSERALGAIPGGVSHNLRKARPFPLYYTGGEGAWKFDADGHKYVDYSMGNASLLLGYGHPAVAEAMAAGDLGVPCASHQTEVEWAEQVQSLLPCAERTRFCASGTEATLLAVRIARAVTGKDKVIHFKSHWHGWHDYFMRGYRPPFKQPGSAGIPDAVLDTALLADEATAEQDVRRFVAEHDVAAIILEPTGPSWGTVPLREGLLPIVRRLCDENGLILIFDEMISAFRWSPGGLQAASGVTPDLVSLGKILTGGMPGGAIAGKADLMEQLAPGRGPDDLGILHYGTFNAHPLSAASGVATLREVATGEHQAAADRHAAGIREQVGKLIEELGIKGFAYGESSAYHIYLAGPEDGGGGTADLSNTAAEALLSIPPEVIARLQFEVRVHGIDLFSYNGGVASSAHGEEELEVAVGAFRAALTTLRDEGLVAA